MAKRLRPLVVSSTRMLKNSSEFLERVRDVRVESDEIMVSFDVKSMFTSLPQDLVKRSVLSAMEETGGYLDNEKLSTSELMRLVNLCLDSTFFNFRDTVYHQRIGTPMGSPISVILAEITMQQFESEILAAAPTSLKLWTRSVDDVFAILKAKDVDGFLEHLNGKHETIQFEMEKEAEGELPFLDVLVKRAGDILVTSVYRKATHTDRLLDFGSDHPTCHKKSVVKTLWNRAERVCSTGTSLKEERSRLRRVFRDNGYPNQVVKRWTAPQRRETDQGEA
ncbi:uncharacterized protein LOC143035632 [Oratosquilla oratoria]|uniref:uncharacterized protein LOC143035632 n=1 Tax=Oratosquilla oratoria TaxID=337810 RepID=UPI003F76720D